MIDHYKMLVRTSDGEDNYEAHWASTSGDNIFRHEEDVVRQAYQMLTYHDEVRKITIEEYDVTKKLLKKVDMMEINL